MNEENVERKESGLKKLREAAGLSQVELARRLRMHKQEISDMERGKRIPKFTAYQYAILLDSLDVSPWGFYKHLGEEAGGTGGLE